MFIFRHLYRRGDEKFSVQPRKVWPFLFVFEGFKEIWEMTWWICWIWNDLTLNLGLAKNFSVPFIYTWCQNYLSFWMFIFLRKRFFQLPPLQVRIEMKSFTCGVRGFNESRLIYCHYKKCLVPLIFLFMGILSTVQ